VRLNGQLCPAVLRLANVAFECTAIRLRYTRPEPRSIAISHHNLANYLREAGTDPAAQRAHRLAAVIIWQLTGMTHNLARTTRALANDLRAEDPDQGQFPVTLEEVIQTTADLTEGVHLRELIAALQPDAQAASEALAQILHTAANMPIQQEPDIARHMQTWEPVIAAVAAVADDPGAAKALAHGLDELAESPDWAALVAVLRRILAGERGDALLTGLDPIDTAIAREVLTRIAAPPADPPPSQP
jgi:hypothetical protein